MMKDTLFIKTKNANVLTYVVECPRTCFEYAQGLAYRKEIPENFGMLYEYNNLYFDTYPQEVSMHTPETEIPVDFIFIDNAGTIIKIHRNAKPLSKERISCYFTASVLEINGGECEKNNINVGDIVFFNENIENDFFKENNESTGKYRKINNDVFCYRNDKIAKVYSYRSHRWLDVDDRVLPKLNKRIEYITKFETFEDITCCQANNFVLNIDALLLEDLMKNKQKYYWSGKNLFVKLLYETGELQYYDFQKGWVKYPWKINYDSSEKLFWRSFLIPSNEIEKRIEEIKTNNNKKELKTFDKENKALLEDMLTVIFYRSLILFKTEHSDLGWEITDIYGDKKTALKTCKKNVKNQKWVEYKYLSNEYFEDKESALEKMNICSCDVLEEHDELFAFPKDNKFYFLSDVLKMPFNSRTIKVNNFSLNVKRNQTDDEYKDFIIQNEDKVFCKIKYDDYELWKELKCFKNALNKNKGVALNTSSFSSCVRVVANIIEDKIRLIIAVVYPRKTVKADMLVDKTVFMRELDKVLDKLS